MKLLREQLNKFDGSTIETNNIKVKVSVKEKLTDFDNSDIQVDSTDGLFKKNLDRFDNSDIKVDNKVGVYKKQINKFDNSDIKVNNVVGLFKDYLKKFDKSDIEVDNMVGIFKDDLERFDSVISEADTGAVGGFTGRSGQDVDTLFAGPFHPDFGNIGELLLGQLEWRKLIAAWNDGITPEYDVWMKLIGSIHLQKQKESGYESDEEVEKKRRTNLEKFINHTDDMMDVAIDLKFDMPDSEEKKNFVNNTNQWKSVFVPSERK
tara:strand:- start:206 stop:994 length:789 start_codon:yes stop_codon:yes gene_type:complete